MIFHPWNLSSKPHNLRFLETSLLGLMFFSERILWEPLLLYLIWVLIMSLYAQTNFFPQDMCGKKENVSINRVKWVFTYTDTQEPHISSYIHFAPANARCAHLLHQRMSPLHIVAGKSIGPRSRVKHYTYNEHIMNTRPFCWLVFFRLLT